MNTLEQHKLENQYAELMQQKLSYILKKLMVPQWLDVQIKRLAQVLGLGARYANNPKQNFLYSLSKLYKKVCYGLEEEKAAFEKTKKEQPHDFNNRLVYADWLQENGDEHEAEFQRSMANWLRDKADKALQKGPTTDYNREANPHWAYLDDQPYKLREAMGYYPEGVNPRHFVWQHSDHNGLSIPYKFSNPNPRGLAEDWISHPTEEEPDGTIYNGYLSRFAWPSFEHMENAFRKAFKK